MEYLIGYQYAWMIYLVGAIGCCLATWLLFRRAGRAWVHFFVITVAVLLLPPFALNLDLGDNRVIMAPALFSLVFDLMDTGFDTVRPIAELLVMLWLGAQLMSLLYQFLTRHRYAAARQALVDDNEANADDAAQVEVARRPRQTRHLRAEEAAKAGLENELPTEEPIHAIR